MMSIIIDISPQACKKNRMKLTFAPLVLVTAALTGLTGGCGGDDLVDATNPDASPKKTADGGASDGSKDGPTDGSKASTDAAHEAAADS